MKNHIRWVSDRFRSLAVWRDTRGQDFVEYALLAGLVAVASALVLPGMSDSMKQIYSLLASKLSEAA